MKKIIVLALLALIFIFPRQAKAEDTLLFDSTDHYLGACQLTDKSEWELSVDANVSLFRVWYSWGEGETELPVTILRDGEPFAQITTTRSQCDPYQAQWCNGDYQINKLFPKGKYSTQIPEARQCLKPGGTGTILLYGKEADATQPQPLPAKTAAPAPTCSCTNKILITAIVASIGGFLIAFFLFKKK